MPCTVTINTARRIELEGSSSWPLRRTTGLTIMTAPEERCSRAMAMCAVLPVADSAAQKAAALAEAEGGKKERTAGWELPLEIWTPA